MKYQKTEPLYLALAKLLQRKRSLANFHTLGNPKNLSSVYEHCDSELRKLCREYLPSGSGFDAGTSLVEEACFTGNKGFPSRLVFSTSFHHLNEHGSYDGWSEHKVIVTPDWEGFDLRVTDRDRNQIKGVIAETFHQVLSSPITYETMPEDYVPSTTQERQA